MSKSLQQNYLSPRFEINRIGQTISDLNKGIYNRKIRLQFELNIKRSYHRLVEPFSGSSSISKSISNLIT